MELGGHQSLPSGVTQLGFSFNYASFRRHLDESTVLDLPDGPGIDAINASLAARHFFGEGWSADLQIPVGFVRYRPSPDAPAGRLAGLGDLEIGGRYDFSALWGAGGYRPSIALRIGLRLPSGKQEAIMLPGVPPNLLSVGLGAFALSGRLEAIQSIAPFMGLRGSLSLLQPMSATESGLSFGGEVGYSAGFFLLPTDVLSLGMELQGSRRAMSSEQGEGELLNSGGHWLSAALVAGIRLSDRASFSVQGELPVYASVNGAQTSMSLGLGASLVLRFGGESGEEGHDHGAEGAGEHEGHDHGAEGAGEHEGHVHGESGHHEGSALPGESPGSGPEHLGVETEKPGDVSDLALGGESFVLASAPVPGKVTVLDFWADWCRPCKSIEVMLRRLAGEHEDLAVRRVEVPDFESAVAREHLHGVEGLPVVWLFDRSQRRAHVLVGVPPDVLEAELLSMLGSSRGTVD